MDIELTKEVLIAFLGIAGTVVAGVGGTLVGGYLQHKWSSERLTTEWHRQDQLRAMDGRRNAEERLLADVDVYLGRCAEMRTFLGMHIYAETELPVAVIDDGVTTIPSRTVIQQEYGELVRDIVRLSTLAHASLSALKAPGITEIHDLLGLVATMQDEHKERDISSPTATKFIDAMSEMKGIVLNLRSPEVVEQQQA